MSALRKVEPRRRDLSVADRCLMDQSHSGEWHIVETLERKERLVRELLRVELGLNVYLPMIPVQRKKNRRVIELMEPLLVGYVFVQFDRRVHVWHPILTTIGVRCLLSFSKAQGPAVVPAGHLAVLDKVVLRARKEFEDRRHGRKPNHSFKPGDLLRIKDGPFESFIGLLDKVSGADLEIRLALFGRSTLVTLPHESVELVDAPA